MRLDSITILTSLSQTSLGYRTNPSDIHITSSLDLKASTMHGGTSWPTTSPASSTISMVTCSGLGNPDPQNST